MALRDRLRRHRKDTRFIVVGLAVLLAVLTAIFYLTQRSRELPEALVNNQVLLFALWYVNVVLILAILFVLIRNLVKLLVERRHRILGSKFKVKLVLTYIGLSLVPGLLLFAYATELLQSSVDRWIGAPLETVFERGNTVVQGLYGRLEMESRRAATRALDGVADVDLDDPGQRPELARRLQRLQADLGVDYLAVYQGDAFLQGVVDPRAGMTDLPEPGRNFLAEVAREGVSLRRIQAPGGAGRLVLAAVPGGSPEELSVEDGLSASNEAQAEAAAESAGAEAAAAESAAAAEPPAPLVVVAGVLMDPQLAAVTEELVQAYQGHRQLAVQRDAIEASHLLIFLLVTLLILLASSWVGLYLARRITVPIQALARGTQRIASGDLDHRVATEADDELGVLVDSFNRMTEELQRSRTLIERSNAELVEANARLAEERALISAVVRNVAAGVIASDPDGRIVTCNDAALEMLQQSEAEVVGKHVLEAWQDPERGKLVRFLRGGTEADGAASASIHELHLVLGGEWRSFEVKMTPMVAGDGSVLGRVMVLENLTELLKAQQLAAWNEAARRIAHEIKNPLTPIKLAAQRMAQKVRKPDVDREEVANLVEGGVDTIVREVAAMQDMVDEFSRYARMPRPQLVATDLGRLIEDTVPLYRDLKPGVEVEVSTEGDTDAVLLDPEQVKRVLINLLDNALQATDGPGTVRVSAEAENGSVTLQVSDTGRGVSAEDKEKLFLPYFSTKGRGTGLGLAIVHRIVSDHHGTIRVADNRPSGTVFTVELPAR